ncbi:MAG: SUF system NifU family Fe-S cluster assembly protein [Gammaproteobacteria bacterium]
MRELYQEVIIDHNRNPRNFYAMENASSHAEGYNPLCGDKLNLYLKIEHDTIVDASFTGEGCAISTASASIMIESLIGKTVSQAQAVFEQVHTMLTCDHCDESCLGKLAIFSGVKAYPARVKCATLAWHTLLAAIKNNQDIVTTE